MLVHPLGKIMSYEDIVAVREQREEREVREASKVRRVNAARCEAISPLPKELQAAEAEIRTMELGNHCDVLHFWFSKT